MNTKACIAALLLATGTVVLAQVPASNDAPLPANTVDDLAARMAVRRAQQLQLQNGNTLPPTPPAPAQPFNTGGAPASPPPEPRAEIPIDPHWKELVTRLASDSFREREAAQQELDKATWRDHDLLRQLADSATDPEAKARLVACVEKMEEQIMLDPPPLTLEVKSATLSDVIDAMEKAMGEKFIDPDMRVLGNAVYTLSVKDKPFWEVFRDLSEQHPLTIQSAPRIRGSGGIRLMQQSPGMHPTQIVGGLAVFARSITRTATVDLQNDPGQPPQPATLNIQYMVALDPRMKVAKYQPARLTLVRDDAGNVLLDEQNVVGRPGLGTTAQNNVWTTSQSLAMPEKLGKKIAIAKGEFHVALQLAAENIDVTDIEKKLNVPQNIAGQTVVISQFEVQGNRIQFRISQSTAGRNRGGEASSPMTVAFIDAAGKQIFSSGASSSGSISSPNIQLPLKLRFTVVTKTKEVTIPFEMKDLPLP